MRALITGGLCAALGIAAAHAIAQEPAWRPSSDAPAASAITLSRPIPVASEPVQPAHYAPAAATLARPMPLVRAKAPDLDEIHQVMPLGPSDVQPGAVKAMSQAEPPPMPMPLPKSTFVAPQPQPVPGTVIEGPVMMVPPGGVMHHGGIVHHGVISGPVVAPGVCGDPCCTPIVGDCCVTDCCTETICCGEVCEPWWHRLGKGHCWDHCCVDACCLPRPRKWIRAEYLLWHFSNQDMPPLLTGETFPGRGIDQGAGTLPRSPILFGDLESNEEVRSGVRTQLGFWFPRHQNIGLDASFFMLVRRAHEFEISSDAGGSPVLARPFFDVTLPGENAQIVSFPGEFAGQFLYESTTKIWGADINLRKKLHCGPRYWLDCFVGYRHMQVNDRMTIEERILDINRDPGDLAGFRVRDEFSTRNVFNGGQFGFEGELRLLRRWFLGGTFKLALGNVHQVVNIDGSTDFQFQGGGSVRGTGGLLALVSNIGRVEREEFAVIPELGVKIGVDVTDHLRIFAGYNFLYLSNAVRAGEQIDRNINPNLLPDVNNLRPAVVNPARPAVLFRQSDFWAGGGNFGLEYHW